MQRNLLFSLMIWLLEVILVASFVSDRWTREIQATEDRLLIAYFGEKRKRRFGIRLRIGLINCLSKQA